MLRDAPPAATLEALAGVAIGPDDCGRSSPAAASRLETPTRGRTFDRAWVAVDAADTTNWLQQVDGAWRLAARDAGPDRGAIHRLRRRAGPARSVCARLLLARPRARRLTDLTIRLSQVDINVPLEARRLPGRRSAGGDADHPRAASRGGPAWPLRSTVVRSALRVRVRAYAKVNLDLRVLGNRADGYHELRTVFQSVASARHAPLRDAARAVRAEMPHVGRAARRVEPRVARGVGALDGDRTDRHALRHLDLDQERDSAAGGPRRRQRRRGGGAAGARARVGWSPAVGRPRRRRRDWRRRAVLSVRRHGTWASGGAKRSIRLSTCRRTGSSIVQPPYGISTAEAYSWYEEDRAAGHREPREPQMLPVPWPTRAAQMINDLEPPVVRRHPEIGTLKTVLREAGAVAAAMSGSGSAVFGLFRTQAARDPRAKPRHAGWRPCAADPHLEPRRARTPRPSGCH